jgi:hypothetical protein
MFLGSPAAFIAGAKNSSGIWTVSSSGNPPNLGHEILLVGEDAVRPSTRCPNWDRFALQLSERRTAPAGRPETRSRPAVISSGSWRQRRQGSFAESLSRKLRSLPTKSRLQNSCRGQQYARNSNDHRRLLGAASGTSRHATNRRMEGAQARPIVDINTMMTLAARLSVLPAGFTAVGSPLGNIGRGSPIEGPRNAIRSVRRVRSSRAPAPDRDDGPIDWQRTRYSDGRGRPPDQPARAAASSYCGRRLVSASHGAGRRLCAELVAGDNQRLEMRPLHRINFESSREAQARQLCGFGPNRNKFFPPPLSGCQLISDIWCRQSSMA